MTIKTPEEMTQAELQAEHSAILARITAATTAAIEALAAKDSAKAAETTLTLPDSLYDFDEDTGAKTQKPIEEIGYLNPAKHTEILEFRAFKDATLLAQESYSTAQNALKSHEEYRDELAALIG